MIKETNYCMEIYMTNSIKQIQKIFKNAPLIKVLPSTIFPDCSAAPPGKTLATYAPISPSLPGTSLPPIMRMPSPLPAGPLQRP